MRLWDGSGEAPIDDGWLRIVDGRVAAVGAEPAPDGPDTVIDLGGRTVIPGLIDAHVHLEALPGGLYRDEDSATRDAQHQHSLRATLAAGVTTVLDAGIATDHLSKIRTWSDEGVPGPRVLTLGPVLGPRDGYVHDFLPWHTGADTKAEVDAHLDLLEDLDVVGLKLTIEEGYLRPIWPLHSPEFRDYIATETAARDLPLYVHAQSVETHREALRIGAHAIVHGTRDPVDDFAQELAETGTYVISTLQIYDLPSLMSPDHLASPAVQRLVPEVQIATSGERSTWRQLKRHYGSLTLPRLPPFLVSAGAAVTPLRGYYRRELKRTSANVAAMHAAGVPVVLGSDAGAYELVPAYFHGVSTLVELDRLVAAGLSPEEALIAGTRTAADMLGRTDELGCLRAGCVADLVVLDADPLVDISALNSPHAVMQGGALRSPEAWLTHPGQPPYPR